MINAIGLTSGIFLLIGVGALARRAGLLKYEDRVALNNIIIFISLPALIFSAAREAKPELTLVYVALTSLAIGLSTLAVGFGIAKLLRLRGPVLGAFLLASGVGNTGYLGYPLTQAIFGQKHVVEAVFFDIFGTVIILFTAGIYFANKYGRSTENAASQAITYAAPNLAALFLGFVLSGAALPAPVESAVAALGQSTTGIIMLSIGLSLSADFGGKKLPVVALTCLKLAVMPAVGLIFAMVLPLPSLVREIVVLQSSMPVALMTFVIGDKYELDRDFLSGAILLSTLLSMLTIPAWRAVAQILFLS